VTPRVKGEAHRLATPCGPVGLVRHERSAQVAGAAETGGTITLVGDWTALGLRHEARGLRKELARYASDPSLRWDVSRVRTLDHVGALLLWRAWGRHMPANVVVRDDTKREFAGFH